MQEILKKISSCYTTRDSMWIATTTPPPKTYQTLYLLIMLMINGGVEFEHTIELLEPLRIAALRLSTSMM